MQFTSVFYPFFFAATAVLYFILPRRAQNWVLLAASLLFYGLNLPHGAEVPLWKTLLPAVVLAFSLCCTYFTALAIDRNEAAPGRRRAAAAGIGALLLVLCS